MKNTLLYGSSNINIGFRYNGYESIISAVQICKISITKGGFYLINLERICFNGESFTSIFNTTAINKIVDFELFIRHKSGEETIFKNCIMENLSVEYKADDYMATERCEILSNYKETKETIEILSEKERMIKDIIE